MIIDDRPNRACKSHNVNNRWMLFTNICTQIGYNMLHDSAKNCEIYLHGTIIEPSETNLIDVKFNWKFIDAFRVKIAPCPPGFALNKILKICQCDSILKTQVISIDSCNIDDQTIQRPGNSWIVGNTNSQNNHTYQVSSHCPFDYCLPHSLHLNISNPDSQCQFDRTGLLCGRCKEGFSTVFSTSQCRNCSSTYLLLLFLFTLLGIALIIFLFVSNFTVADGSINGFIYYANIVSINGPVFFPNYMMTKYAFILISFVNLDLGIDTCFYNGMDDYAKMWLQLIFPMYLIFIATLLIITSRYSTRIQRLTARRALPVLATLFLLSYTKILRTVSSVLFSYSTITNLPNKTTTLVWSVDTDTKLFGSKFNFLFAVCLVLFLILLPFNAILRTLSRFKFINHFKPLLDAYQGPYWFYYWIGIQLLLSAVFYGISALDKNTNMMIGIIIFGAMECIHGRKFPFKSKAQNYQELLLIFNLHIPVLFATSASTTSNFIAVTTLVGLAFVQFIIFTLYRLMLHRNLKISWTPLTRLNLKCVSFLQSPPDNLQRIEIYQDTR